MVPAETLQKNVQDGLDWVLRQAGVAEAEIFTSVQNLLLVRLNYTSHIPCHGVEEPKSIETLGVGVHVVFLAGESRRVGFGSQAGELSLNGIQRAFEKARLAAVEDPDFHHLPVPAGSPTLTSPYHDPSLMSIEDQTLVDLGWQALSGAIDVFRKAGVHRDIVVGGDVSLLQEKMALANSGGVSVWDEAAIASASITSMLEAEEAKGSGWSLGTRLSNSEFNPDDAGRKSAESALSCRQGERIPSGEYRVILGPQAVADILGNIVLPSVSLSTIDAACSAFQGKLGQQIADSRLTLYDHGALPDRPGSRRFTCEGLPTGKTVLIDKGKLVGFLANHYYQQKVLRSPDAEGKLGASPMLFQEAFIPRNGFRPGESLGRNFLTTPSIVPTNVIVEADETLSLEHLMRQVQEGIYIGRIWYTYPMNGLGPGDFTSTIVGDSFLIRNGKREAPLKPNTVRVHENIHHVLQRILAFGDSPRPVLLWGSPEVIYTPEIAVSDVRLEAIGR
jgi:PmbA protein